jgi:hypothetical protein
MLNGIKKNYKIPIIVKKKKNAIFKTYKEGI